MRHSDIVKALRGAGFYVVYNRTKAKRDPPYLRILSPGTNNQNADNRVYQKIRKWRVFLVTANDKDPEAEERLEAALDSAGICYDIEDETYIEAESLYQTIYEFEEMEGAK